jgi:hypothetical protein
MDMTIRRFYSNTAVQTTLAAGIGSSDLSLTVVNASGYPITPFTIVVESEVVLVGTRSGTTFSDLVRGYGDTAPSSHALGSTVEHRAVADDFDKQWIDVLTIDDTETIYDDEFDDGDQSDWSQVTPTGTATWTEARGKLSVLYTGQSSNDCAANLTPLNGLSYPLYIVTAVRSLDVHADFNIRGPLFSAGTATSSAAVWFMVYYDNSNAGRWLFSLRSGTLTNINTIHWNVEMSYGGMGWVFMRLDWVATNLWRAWASPDGVSWSSLGQANTSATLAPDLYGVGVSTFGTSNAITRVATYDMFRVYVSKPSYWQEL